jgi:hypothetical protein
MSAGVVSIGLDGVSAIGEDDPINPSGIAALMGVDAAIGLGDKVIARGEENSITLADE